MLLHDLHAAFRQGKRIFDLGLSVTYYARVSTDSDEQENSLQNQKSFFEEMIQKNTAWEFVDGYVDEGITGTSVKHRKAFLRMIEDAKKGKFQLVLTKEVSRFARDTVDSLQYTRLLLDHGVGVFFLNDNINTLDSDGELRLTIMASIAQDESRKISERIRFGYRKSISEGKIIGNAPLGYRKNNKGLEIIEEEAVIVRKIFELYNSGLGFRLVSDKLADMGYFASSGNKYSTSVISSIIRNPKYKGCLAGGRFRRTSYRDHRQQRLPESEWILTENHDLIPPIVDEDTWNKANDVYKRKREYALIHTPIGKAGQYLYSGKLICMEHGLSFHRVVMKSGKEKWQCEAYRHRGVYGCSMPHLYTSELNAVMRQVFEGVVRDRDLIIQNIVQQIKELYETSDFSEEIRVMEKQRSEIEQKRQKLIDLLMQDVLSADDYKGRNEDCIEQIEKIDQRILELQTAAADVKTVKLNIGQIEKALQRYTSFDDDMILEDFVRDFLAKIEVSKTDRPEVTRLNIVLKNAVYENPSYLQKNGKGASGVVIKPQEGAAGEQAFFSDKRIILSSVP